MFENQEDLVDVVADARSELEESELESETDRLVRCWRFEQFTLLGFSIPTVVLLAHSAADLNEARRLIRLGCAPDLAADILL